jgi:hypothetical protein
MPSVLKSVPIVVSFAVAGLRGRASAVVVKLKELSNSLAKSKDGMWKAARPGRLLKPGDRSTGAAPRLEGGGLESLDKGPEATIKFGAECEP